MGEIRGDEAPESCDCCGRDAEDCGMLDEGWVRDSRVLSGGAAYCRTCAHLLGVARLAEKCAWCETPMVDEGCAETLGWGYFADTLGALHPCCPGCLAESFGISARGRLRPTP